MSTRTDTTDPAPPTSMRLDLASAYAASAARVGSWAVVSALVFRASPAAFAVLALVRATVGILNYTSLGLGPAMVHALARTRHTTTPAPTPLHPSGLTSADERTTGPHAPVLSYAVTESSSAPETRREAIGALFVNGCAVAGLAASLGFLILLAYVAAFDRIHKLPAGITGSPSILALLIGAGTLLRLASDAPGAVLQTEGRIALDNGLLMAAEVAWMGFTAAFIGPPEPWMAVGFGHLISSLLLLVARLVAVDDKQWGLGLVRRCLRLGTMAGLLKFGAGVALAQVADFLYAPTDYFLINRLIDPLAVATYAPAVQVDAGLLLLVGGLAAVLLPKSAVAHAAGDTARVRRYYVRGTLGGGALLLAAALAFWALSPFIFRLWLGSDLPATRRLLPLVLLHTVLGGSSAVGRSVLLATGKVRAFTASVLIAGMANVVLSYALARFTGLGLYGIVLGTVIVVTGRCVVWMPWYVLRTLRPGPAAPR